MSEQYARKSNENAERRSGQTRQTCCERKRPTAYSISFVVGFIKDLDFSQNHFEMWHWNKHEITSICGDSTRPPEDDHMANGRVEMAVWGVKRQCRTLQISAEQQTHVRIAEDPPLLSWLLHSAAVMNKRCKREQTETNQTKMEETHGTIRRECVVLQLWRRWCQFLCTQYDFKILCWSSRSSGSKFFCITKSGVVRSKIWTTRQPLRDAGDATTWESLCGTPCQMVAFKLKNDEESQIRQRKRKTSIVEDCSWKNSWSWVDKILRIVSSNWGSRPHWKLSWLCSDGIAWQSNKATRLMSRTTQSNYYWEYLDGQGENGCIQRESC